MTRCLGVPAHRECPLGDDPHPPHVLSQDELPEPLEIVVPEQVER